MRWSSRCARVLLVTAVGVTALAGCGQSSGSAPDTATSESPVAGQVPMLNQTTVDGLTIHVSVRRSDNRLVVTGDIVSSGGADSLRSVGSQVTETLKLSPALAIPAGGTVTLDGSRALTLVENAELTADATLDLALDFAQAGDVRVFASFTQD